MDFVEDFTDLPGMDDERYSMFWYYVFLCLSCGFWSGHFFNEAGFSDLDLGVFGALRKHPLESEHVPVAALLPYLNENSALLTRISPFKAEKVVARLLAERLECEVQSLGGRGDGGIDSYIVVNDKIQTIIQVKWRRDSNRAESVNVVRELAGTLLARGVPCGLIVTTRKYLSAAALSEITAVGRREVVGVGKIALDYVVYNDLIDMLSISARRITDKPRLPLDIESHDIGALFGLENAVASDSVVSRMEDKAKEWRAIYSSA